ncbi:MAG TPA: hypothetical protein ENK36_03015 [Desulfobacterales bacterium]|nr:hypothetical protein [Desulfobacterales bacterium]
MDDDPHADFKGVYRLEKILSKRFLQVKDSREADRIKDRLHDFFMTDFAMMYFQDPSLLIFQRRLQKAWNLNNKLPHRERRGIRPYGDLKTMFNIESIPKIPSYGIF